MQKLNLCINGTSIIESVLKSKVYDFCVSAWLVIRKYSLVFNTLAILFYRVVLDMVYVLVVSPMYSYAGLTFNFSALRLLLSWMTTIIIAIPIISQYKRVNMSATIITVCNLIYFLPMQTLYAFMGFELQLYAYFMIYWVLMFAFQHCIPVIKLKPFNADTYIIFNVSTLILILFVVFISWKYTGLSVYEFHQNEYNVRLEAAAYDMSSAISYVFTMAAPVLSVLTVYWLSKKRYFLSLLLICVSYLHFSVNAMKSNLVLILLTVLGYAIYRDYLMPLLSLGLGVLGLLGILEFMLQGSIHIVTNFFRRTMFIPVLLSTQYYDYFTRNPPDLWRSGVLRWVGFKSPYVGRIPDIIGWQYQDVATNACNGLLGDACSSFGTWGIIIMPFVIVLCLRLCDACSSRLEGRVLIGIAVFLAMGFCNGSWSTLLLSGGIFAVSFLWALWPTDKLKGV